MSTKVNDQVRANGFDTGALGGLLKWLEEHPEGGRVTFMSDSQWQEGGRVKSSVAGYRIDGETRHEHERRFEVVVDEPSEFGAGDSASAPVEHLMYATASCIAATIAAFAALQGVGLSRLQVALESDVDLHGMFALDKEVRPGLGEIRAEITLAGDADAETLRNIARLGYNYSVVRDSVAHGVRIRPQITVDT